MRRVRLLFEVDCVVSNVDYDDDGLVADTANYMASIIDQAEDDAEQKLADGELYPVSYRLDADDLTVWTPSKYLGALLAVRRLSKTARSKLREFDRLPATDRRALLVARLRRNNPGVGMYASCPGCGAKVAAETRPRPNGSIVRQGTQCPICGRIEPHDTP